MKRHSKSFFGSKNALIFDSEIRDLPHAYLQFIEKKGDVWEKPSMNQGKKIKLNLGELIMFHKVLQNLRGEYSTVHNFNGETTTISIRNQNRQFNQNRPCNQNPQGDQSKRMDHTHKTVRESGYSGRNVWIKVNNYTKLIREPEIDILEKMLDHVINEKIIYSTGNNYQYQKNESNSF